MKTKNTTKTARTMKTTKTMPTTKTKTYQVFECLKNYHQQAQWQPPLTQSGLTPPRDASYAVWALDAARGCHQISLRFTRASSEPATTFGSSFQTPRPAASATIAFNDAAVAVGISYSAPGLRQINRSPDNDCCCFIGVSLAVKPPESAVMRLRKFLCTTFAGNEEARFLDQAMEALCFFGRPLPQKIILLLGSGSG